MNTKINYYKILLKLALAEAIAEAIAKAIKLNKYLDDLHKQLLNKNLK